MYASSQAFEIIVGCRTIGKGEDAIETAKKDNPQSSSDLSVLQVDLSSDASIDAAVQDISSKYGRVDVLINNGGAGFDRQIDTGDMTIREAFNTSWDTNVTGTHVLTSAAVPLLLKSPDPRLMFLTSGTSTLAETERFDHPSSKGSMHHPLQAGPRRKG